MTGPGKDVHSSLSRPSESLAKSGLGPVIRTKRTGPFHLDHETERRLIALGAACDEFFHVLEAALRRRVREKDEAIRLQRDAFHLYEALRSASGFPIKVEP